MVTTKETIEKIRKIIEKHYSAMTISALGSQVFTKEELEKLARLGVDVSNRQSLLDLIYYHNFLNSPVTPKSPPSVQDARAQQSQPGILPEGAANAYTVSSLNEKTKQLIEKLRSDTIARIEGIIRDNNDAYKFDALQNLDRTDIADALVKESSLGKVKQRLRDTSGDANRDWQRVALTEMSNAIGVGSADRIVTDNRDRDLNEVYVYRVIVGDALTCFPETEEILMASGEHKQLKDVKVGDLVQSATRKKDRNVGSAVRVTSVFTKPEEVFRYEFEDGTVIDCTEDHPILVKSKNFLGFLPVRLLEKSKIKFLVVKYSELTTSEKASVGRMPKWAKTLSPNERDFFYFWSEFGDSILFDCATYDSFEQVSQKWGLPKLSASRKTSELLQLCGFDTKKYRSHKKNSFNSKYIANKREFTLSFLKDNKDLVSSHLLEFGYGHTSKKYKISRNLLLSWVKNYLTPEFRAQILRNNKKRAKKSSQQSIDSKPELKARLASEARNRLVNSLGTPSRPQKALFNTLKTVFKNCRLEAPILGNFRADILINDFVIVEFDGSGHFLFGQGSETKDVVRDKICRRAGYAVIRVSSKKDSQPDLHQLSQIIKSVGPGEFALVKVEK